MKVGNHNQGTALAYSSRVLTCFQDKQKHFSPAKKWNDASFFQFYVNLFQSFELWKSYSFPFFPSASFTIFVFSMSKNKEIKIMIFFQTFKVSPQRYRFTENHEGLEPLCQSFD